MAFEAVDFGPQLHRQLGFEVGAAKGANFTIYFDPLPHKDRLRTPEDDD